MSGQACYLARADRGGRVVEARLIGHRTDESWSDGEHPPEQAAALAAAWVAQRLSHSDTADGLRLLCVDVDGGVCGWVSAPSAEPSVVVAAVQGSEGPLSGATRTEASIQALAEPKVNGTLPRLRRKEKAAAAPTSERLAVLQVPDAAARLFIDELDDRGVGVDSVVSLWHAIARAWDPGGPAGSGSRGAGAERVVATAATVTGIALIDTLGRLSWVWSRGGELLTAGSVRMVVDGAEGGVRVDAAAISRLAADWLAWSAQLGVAPTRILVVAPPPEESGGSLSPAGIGQALTRVWPGASADLIIDPDPIGTTLGRLTEVRTPARGDPKGSLVALTHRPSRAHRSLTRAAALGLGAAALALGALAWQTFRSASVTRANADAIEASNRSSMAKVVPAAEDSQAPEMELQAALDKARSAHEAPSNFKPVEPILEELDTVSFVLSGIPGVQAEDYSFNDSMVSITLSVPDTRTGEDVLLGLRQINSHCEWKGSFPSGTGGGGGRLRYLLEGAWIHKEKP